MPRKQQSAYVSMSALECKINSVQLPVHLATEREKERERGRERESNASEISLLAECASSRMCLMRVCARCKNRAKRERQRERERERKRGREKTTKTRIKRGMKKTG